MNTMKTLNILVDEVEKLREQVGALGDHDGLTKNLLGFYHSLQDVVKAFQEHLEYVIQENPEQLEKIEHIRSTLMAKQASYIIDRLFNTGSRLSYHPAIRASFEKQKHYILQLVSYGNRPQVLGILLHIIISQLEYPPRSIVRLLTEASKPIYPDDLFQVFMMAFLSSIVSEKDTNQKQNQKQ